MVKEPCKTCFYLIALFLWVSVLSFESKAQDTLTTKKSSHVKTIWDIPHKTFIEKWMWIHRSVAFNIVKEKKINYNTDYIQTYTKHLVVTVPVTNRFLQFTIRDLKTNNKLNFIPNREYDLGISISSRWASFIINSNIKILADKEKIKGKTDFKDYQLNLYSRKFTTDMFVQYYKGFYIRNSRDYNNYTNKNPYEIRTDVYALHIGVSSYYIINNKRFSYRNSFAFTEKQKKSAGTILLGIYYSYFTVSGDSSLVSSPFRGSFDSLSLIKNGQTHDFGFNLGYIYTLVFLKKYYATASLVQGIGGKYTEFKRDDNTNHNKLSGGAGIEHIRFGLGYDYSRIFGGAMGMFDFFLFGTRTNSVLDYSYGKFMIYVGYRFSVLKPERKFLRRLKLVDY